MIYDHKAAMQLAIQEGEKGWGFVSPNPAVGCVILDKDGCLISKSYHKKFGSEHAEVNAVNQIKKKRECLLMYYFQSIIVFRNTG